MAALINAPCQQSNPPLPGLVDPTDANPAGKNSFEALGVAKLRQGCKLVLGCRQCGLQPLVPLCGAVKLAIGDLQRLAAGDQDLRQALIPKGVFKSQGDQRACAEPPDQ